MVGKARKGNDETVVGKHKARYAKFVLSELDGLGECFQYT